MGVTDLRGTATELTRRGERVRRAVKVRADGVRMRRELPVASGPELITVGNVGYGGQVIPDGVLTAESTCYGVGVGEDITFDLGLIARYGVTVHAFDPVPRAARYAAAAAAHEPRFVFHPWAVWERDEPVTFHEPVQPGYVSQSAVDLHGTPVSFTAQGRSVASIMTELGHDTVDLLKVSAEGAEFAVLENVLSTGVHPRIICAEYSLPSEPGRVAGLARRLGTAGYRLVSRTLDAGGWKATWLGATTA
jgi:FkbM family methyltransferase